MAISSLGVGSGLDLNSLVEGLLSAERQPVENRLNVRETKLQTELSAFGIISSALSGLESAISPLEELSTGRTASSSNSSVLTVSADETAAIGGYTVTAERNAQALSLASSSFADTTTVLGEGELTFTFGNNNFDPDTDSFGVFDPNTDKDPVSITIDSSNNTLEGIKNAINEADFGVTAVIVNDGSGYRLLMSSNETGVDNGLEISITGDSVGTDIDDTGLSQLAFNSTARQLTQTVAAQDAQIVINGLTVNSSTDEFSDVIPGVTLNVKDPSTEQVSVNIALDKGRVNAALKGFVDAYNQVIDDFKRVSSYDPETEQAGVLLGDSFIRGVSSTLRNQLVSSYGIDGSSINTFIDIGIKTEEGGRLSIDSERLNEALDNNYDDVLAFANSAGEALASTMSSYVGTEGLVKSRQESIQQGISRINDERIALDLRLEKMEQRLVKQYSSLDTLLSGLQSTSNFISTQLASLDFSYKPKS